jgi:two-component system invasion response regulator UvrY
MIRILIADDHEIVRKGLVQIVADTPDIEVCGEAGNAQETLGMLRQQTCSVVVLDLSMPGGSGLDVLKDIKCHYPHLPVLILSTYSEDEYAVRVLKAGAAGYLTKRSAPKELIAAIRKVHPGGKYISEFVAEKLASNFETSAGQAPHTSLSDREYQVMCMIASGKTLREIADDLSLSEKTISTYRTRIMEKMAMKKNTELVRYAMQYGLLE